MIVKGDRKAFWMYEALLVRQAYMLELNLESPDPSITPLERERRRRLWWSCFTFDRQCCVIGGIGPSQMAPFEPFPVKLPAPDCYFNHAKADDQLPRAPAERSRRGHAIALIGLMARIADCYVLESIHAQAASSNLLFLGAALEDWFASAPPGMMSLDGDATDSTNPFSSGGDHDQSLWFRIQTNFFFHGTVILLYKSRLCQEIQANPTRFLYSSAFPACLASSTAISELCQLMIKYDNPAFLYMDPFTNFCRFLAGWVACIILRWGTLPESVRLAQEQLDIIKSSLLAESQHSHVSKIFYSKLLLMRNSPLAHF